MDARYLCVKRAKFEKLYKCYRRDFLCRQRNVCVFFFPKKSGLLAAFVLTFLLHAGSFLAWGGRQRRISKVSVWGVSRVIAEIISPGKICRRSNNCPSKKVDIYLRATQSDKRVKIRSNETKQEKKK